MNSQNQSFDNIDIGFKHPSTIMISGPTQSGKTYFLCKVLEQRKIHPFPQRIVIVYKEWQKSYDKIRLALPGVEFMHGFNSSLNEDGFFNVGIRNLLILDDLMQEASKSDALSSLFTVGSHHRNLTIVYLVQNQYNGGISSRSVGLNSHYNVIFRNNGDLTQTEMMFRRRGPGASKWLRRAFDDATSRPHGYLILDNRPETPHVLRVRTGILDGELPTIYHDPK